MRNSHLFCEVALLLVACGTPIDESDTGDEFAAFASEAPAGDAKADGWTVLGNTDMQYEGSCAFLLACSSYSTNRVNFGCGDYACRDSELWVAAPRWRRTYCGEKVRICRTGHGCVEPEVRDVSCCGRWEGSHGVLQALGIDHGSSPTSCSGHGVARVTVAAPVR